MTTLRTAAQQALEALQNCANGEDDVLLTRDALAALRTALADGDNLSPTEPFSPDWDRIEPLQENLREHMAEIQRLRSELALQRFTDVNQEIEAALAEPVQQGCDRCNHPLYAAIKCRVCGRVTSAEPVQEPDVPETNFGNMEPVAWLWQHRETGRTRVLMPDERTATDVAAAWDVVGPLYLAPPQRPAEPVQEPVAWSHINGTSDTKWHPPQRKPLTEEEIDELSRTMVKGDRSVNWLCRAIERAHWIE